MLAVVHAGPGVVELNYMWLPTWIGMNPILLKEIERHVSTLAVGKPLDDETLQWLHYEVVSFLRTRFSDIQGLEAYLNSLLNVEMAGAKEED